MNAEAIDEGLPVSWADEALRLLPQRALWWPREATLFVADPHFGKAAAFRANALPVPAGTTAADLQRLDRLLAAHRIRRVVFLGDLLHARAARTDRVLGALADWHRAHPRVDKLLVRGNHDRHAGDPPPALGMQIVEEPFRLGPFACRHHPSEAPPSANPSGFVGAGLLPDAFALAGHLHPVCRLRGAAHDRLRVPCFVADARGAVLPSFGSFTGGHPIEAGPQHAVFAIADGKVWPLPARREPG